MAGYLSPEIFEILDKLKECLSAVEQKELETKLEAVKKKHHFYNSKVNAQDSDLVQWVNQKISKYYQEQIQGLTFKADEAWRLVYALDKDEGFLKTFKKIGPMRVALQPGMIKKLLIGALTITLLLGMLSFSAFGTPILALSPAVIMGISASVSISGMLASIGIYTCSEKIGKGLICLDSEHLNFKENRDSSAESHYKILGTILNVRSSDVDPGFGAASGHSDSPTADASPTANASRTSVPSALTTVSGP